MNDLLPGFDRWLDSPFQDDVDPEEEEGADEESMEDDGYGGY